MDAFPLKLHWEMLGDICRSGKQQVPIKDITQVVQLFQDNESWSLMLPEVVKLLRLFLTLPVTSCTAERSFSCLRRLKTFLRSTLTQKRLNNLAVLHCHREQTVDLSGGTRVLGARGQRYFWRPSPLKGARGLGELLSSPGGSGRSPAAKRILVHLRQIF